MPLRRQANIWFNAAVLLTGPWETNLGKTWIKYNNLHTIKLISKCSLQNGSHFASATRCLAIKISCYYTGYYTVHIISTELNSYPMETNFTPAQYLPNTIQPKFAMEMVSMTLVWWTMMPIIFINHNIYADMNWENLYKQWIELSLVSLTACPNVTCKGKTWTDTGLSLIRS